MREFARKLYFSTAWKKCRESYIAKVHGICERCGAGGKIVHHRIHLNEKNVNDAAIALSHDNLELLCQDCHNEEHMGVGATQPGTTFDERGELVRTARRSPPETDAESDRRQPPPPHRENPFLPFR